MNCLRPKAFSAAQLVMVMAASNLASAAALAIALVVFLGTIAMATTIERGVFK